MSHQIHCRSSSWTFFSILGDHHYISIPSLPSLWASSLITWYGGEQRMPCVICVWLCHTQRWFIYWCLFIFIWIYYIQYISGGQDENDLLWSDISPTSSSFESREVFINVTYNEDLSRSAMTPLTCLVENAWNIYQSVRDGGGMYKYITEQYRE